MFVFGSNSAGFHGAGAAGLACRGDSHNTWRRDPWFLNAMQAPYGSSDRIGRWAVYGVAQGFQEGREGKSYAIQTVTRPGCKRSVSLEYIYSQLIELWKFVNQHPEWTFLITSLGEGCAGYTHDEMDILWKKLVAEFGQRCNVKFVSQDEK